MKDSETSKISVSTQRLENDVYALTHTSTFRNFENLHALEEAANYIREQWQHLGIIVREQKFKAIGNEYKNLYASFGPEQGERIILGAHYDVCGEQPGADDNASGVAGVLEIGRLLKSLNPILKYRIDLLAYTLEEPPFFRTGYMGSGVHAQSLREAGVKVKAMICLEMIGYFSEQRQSQEYPASIFKLFYPRTGNFIAVVGRLGQRKIVTKIKKLVAAVSSVDVRSINAPAFIPGVDFSDHASYWENGFQAVMITDTSFYRNPNYHQAGDTPETLDYKKMAEVVKGVYNALINLQQE